jgi:hypothetical protein
MTKAKDVFGAMIDNIMAGGLNTLFLYVGSEMLPFQGGNELQNEIVRFLVGSTSYYLSNKWAGAGPSIKTLAGVTETNKKASTMGKAFAGIDLVLIGLVNGNVALRLWEPGVGFLSLRNYFVGWGAYTASEITAEIFLGVNKQFYN